MDMTRPRIGDEMTFTPFAWDKLASLSGGNPFAMFGPVEIRVKTTGVVEYINRRHGWFRVRYESTDGTVCHECFRIAIPEVIPEDRIEDWRFGHRGNYKTKNLQKIPEA